MRFHIRINDKMTEILSDYRIKCTFVKTSNFMPNSLKNKVFLLYSSFIFSVFIAGCNNSSGNTQNIRTNNLNTPIFSIYSGAVNSIKLPFKDSCDDTLAIQRLNLPDSLSKFKNYGQLIGKINETQKYTAILYSISGDVQLPVLYVFNKDGKEISSLKLLIGNCCGENEDCSGLSTAQITNDMHIILKDSMQTFERDKRKYDKKRSIQIFKKREEFKIDSTGKIIPALPTPLNS